MACFVGLCMAGRHWFWLVAVASLSSLIIMRAESIKGMVGEVATFFVLTFVLIVFVIIGIRLSCSDDVHLDPKQKKDTH